jgi:hypothetical protein
MPGFVFLIAEIYCSSKCSLPERDCQAVHGPFKQTAHAASSSKLVLNCVRQVFYDSFAVQLLDASRIAPSYQLPATRSDLPSHVLLSGNV